ncbi:ATP-binding protein [Dactylosporangium sp. NPDC051485]|uniref:ATP-binding protein n=1 Tax=Dactylosporangium sp. NPDC051485 TaxID=3154846 RepID=UPI003422DA60
MTGRLRRAVRQVGATSVLAIAAVLVLGLGASWQAASVIRHGQHERAQAVLDRAASLSEAAVGDEIHRYLDTLRTVAAAVGSHDELTAGDFAAITAPLRQAGLVGATSLVFLVAADDGQLPAVQQYWRERGLTGLELRPDAPGREHLFTIFTRTLDPGSPLAAGTDLSQLAEPTAAMYEARRSRQPAVSDTYVLLRDRSLSPQAQQLSFLLAAPAYGDPAADGQQQFKGWVVLGLRGQDFVGGVLSRATQGQAGAELWAQNGSGQAARVAALRQPGEPDLHRDVQVTIANRQWRLAISADSARLGGSAPQLPLLVGLGGTALTLLVCGMLWALAGGRGRAEARVVAATAGLRQAEREASRQVALLNGILDRISDGVGVVDETGAFLVHNPAAKQMLGRTLDADGSEHWQEHYGMFRPDGTTPFPTEDMPLVRALAGESTDRVEMIIRNSDRPEGLLLSVSGRPLEADGRRGAIAVFHDITEAREREADLTAFAGIVAHDLKNPLTVIGAHAEMARDALPDRPEQAAESLDRVGAGVVRMRRLIDDLLAYVTARDAALKTCEVDLAALVADVVGERVNHLRTPPDVYVGALPRVLADPAMLRHVLDNLLGNALKYVHPGRVPKVDISAGPVGEEWVRVEVADRGIGIPEEDKPHVFESFHRAHAGQSYGGTGLGLAICRRIVDRHGGSIAVTDNPGGGSRFSFTVPAAPALTPAAPHHEYV